MARCATTYSVKRTLVAASAVLAVLLVAGCSDDSDGTSPTPSATTAPAGGAETQGPAAGTDSPSGDTPATIAAEDVTDEQKKACLDAIVTQIREKKGGNKPEECAVLPDEVLGPIVDKALSGG